MPKVLKVLTIVYVIGICILLSLAMIRSYSEFTLKNEIIQECYQQSRTQSEFSYCRNKLYYNYTKNSLW